MPRSKFLLVLALLLLLAIPATAVVAQATPLGEGSAVIFDDAAVSDGIEVNISGATPASEGMEYVAWLVDDMKSGFMPLGELNVDADGNASLKFGAESANYTGENLLSMYSGWVISVEEVGASPEMPADYGIASDMFTPDTAEALRTLIGAGADLNAQLAVAETHAQLAASSETLEDLQMHAQHVVNVLEGAEGANYMAEGGDPGDGAGAITHAANAKAAAMTAMSMGEEGSSLASNSAMAIAGFGNAEMWASNARDAALMAIGADSLEIAQIFVGPPAGKTGPAGRSVVAYLDVAANGFDVDGNGMLGEKEVLNEDGESQDPPMFAVDSSEHGAMQAYRNSQKAAALSVIAGGLPVPPTPTPTPEPEPTATPTPVPTATPTPTPTPIQPTAPGLPGLPSVGDASASAAIQFATLIAFALLAIGGVMSIRGRRSRN